MEGGEKKILVFSKLFFTYTRRKNAANRTLRCGVFEAMQNLGIKGAAKVKNLRKWLLKKRRMLR